METKHEYKHIVRIANSDIKGEIPALFALRKIKGVGFSMANAICNYTKLDKKKKAGDLTDAEIKGVEDMLNSPKGIPKWLLNREKDYESGEDKHVVNADLKLSKEFDIKRLQSIKSYIGLRHAWKLPVRGQRTRSNFRKGKSIGVHKSKQKGKK